MEPLTLKQFKLREIKERAKANRIKKRRNRIKMQKLSRKINRKK